MKNNKKRQWLLLASAAVVLVIIIIILIVVGMDFRSTTRIGLIMTGNASDSGWNGMHYSGVKVACEKLGTELVLKENIPEDTELCTMAIDELVADGVQMVMLSSYGYPEIAAEAIDKYTDVVFYGIYSGGGSENMSSYFGRMYQARYLSGIVAAKQSATGSIGYVAAMSNNEVNRGINAFTLGVRSVSPDAEVHVIWTNSWDDAEAEKAAVERLVNDFGADVIAYHQNQSNAAEAADSLGVCSIGYNQTVTGLSDKYLTAAIWNWDSLYYEIIREYIQGKGNSVKHHWFGIEKGVVGLAEYSPLVSEETKQAVEKAENALISGEAVFSGDIFDNNGNRRCAEGESISDSILLEKMDWFVNGVVIHE